MNVSSSDLQKKSREIPRALDRNEKITIFHRRQPKAVLHPITTRNQRPAIRAQDDPTFGIGSDRDDLRTIAAHTRILRKPRFPPA